MNAAEAWRDTGLMPNPPKDEGREAFVQAQSVKGQPTRSDTASLRVSSMELKAFEKSTRRMKRSSGRILGSSRQLETEWTMASHPDEKPTPNCRGAKTSSASHWVALAVHLEVSRRRTSPTAIGRRPPHFFLQGNRMAPQRWGVMLLGILPVQSRLTKLVSLPTTPVRGRAQKLFA